jgi:hypothetical protein
VKIRAKLWHFDTYMQKTAYSRIDRRLYAASWRAKLAATTSDCTAAGCTKRFESPAEWFNIFNHAHAKAQRSAKEKSTLCG